MKKYLLLILICLIQLNFIQGQDNEKPKNYFSVGYFDHKTGPSMVGVARTLWQNEKNEIFVGAGTLIIFASTVSAGWKYYLNDGSYQGYSVLSPRHDILD